MTTSLSEKRRRLYQITVLQKATLTLDTPEVQTHAKTAWMHSLKRMSELLTKEKKYAIAGLYARQALSIKTTPKWAMFTLYVSVRALFQPTATSPQR